ncbi:Gfo/Idh/MocA family oxidoreductase [Paracoccus methylovorus]|uniref:Gfo/Idh/MocA family oxidoreductase n=1 Tax=Paracoccus methylovorus TaxID=2812658 RepID=A0ABX7JN61_9RHOB|nr:Gfo/Idh/MocA family oxidoreductase [Paracoccus methylovorus]QRZ14758.1 Gfo/Idh/MocA family oxidoreductase [Paracoccus methylovorus]
MSVRIGLVGAGIMGADHARIVAEELPGAVLQVICDASPDRAQALAEAWGAADAVTDPAALVLRQDVDAVIVASPDFTHAPLSMACIAAGKPVLCEKPLSPESNDCLRVIEAETASGRQWVQVGFMRRYDQSYAEMKAALASGVLGRAVMMHNFHRNVENPVAGFTADMAITNSAPHEFDVARHVLDTDYSTVTAFTPKDAGGKVGPVVMVLETAGGQLVTIEINNNAAYGYDVRGELVGEKGAISLNAPLHTRLDLGLQQVTTYAADWRPRFGEAYRRQDRAFVDFVQTGRFPEDAASAWDGYAASVVAEAGVRSLREGGRAPVAMIDQPALYASNGKA